MTRKRQLSGLCMNCLNTDKCGYLMNHTKPIIFCEEFSCSDLTESKNSIVQSIKNADHQASKPPKGICCNCANFDICTLQKIKTHTLYCEEYR